RGQQRVEVFGGFHDRQRRGVGDRDQVALAHVREHLVDLPAVVREHVLAAERVGRATRRGRSARRRRGRQRGQHGLAGGAQRRQVGLEQEVDLEQPRVVGGAEVRVV